MLGDFDYRVIKYSVITTFFIILCINCVTSIQKASSLLDLRFSKFNKLNAFSKNQNLVKMLYLLKLR